MGHNKHTHSTLYISTDVNRKIFIISNIKDLISKMEKVHHVILHVFSIASEGQS